MTAVSRPGCAGHLNSSLNSSCRTTNSSLVLSTWANRMLSLCLLLLLLGIQLNTALPSALSAQDRCKDEITTCIKEIQEVLNDSRIVFAQDREQLDKLCGHLNKTVGCVNEFVYSCLGSEAARTYQAMISGTKDLIDRLCIIKSDFRQKYLLHAKCYHELADDYKRCADSYYENEKYRVKTVRETNDINLELRLWCCNYDGHRACTKRAVRDRCGDEAAELAGEIVVISGGDLVQRHCNNVTSANCPAHLTSSAMSGHRMSLAGSRQGGWPTTWLRLPVMVLALVLHRWRP